MADRLGFQLDLTGTMAQALAPINRGLGEVEPRLNRAASSTLVLDRAVVKTQASLAHTGTELSKWPTLTLDIGRGFDMVAGAIGRATGALAGFGRFLLKTAADKQDLDLALRFNTGDQAPAFQRLADSYGNTRFDDGEILHAQMPLFQVGVKDQTLIENLTTAATDIEALSAGQVKFSDALDAFAKGARKGEIDNRVLAPLRIGTADYFQGLATALGVSAAEAEKKNKAGLVKTEVALQALLGVIQDREGGSIGGPSLAAGQTLGASLRRLENLPDNMFKSLAYSPAAKGIQAAIDGFVETLLGPRGVALVGKIGEGLDRIFGGLGSEQMVKGLEKTIDIAIAAIDVAFRLGSAFESVYSAVIFVGEAYGIGFARIYLGAEAALTAIVGWATSARAAIAPLWNWIAGLGGQLASYFFDVVTFIPSIGAAIVNGLISGMTGALGGLRDAINGIGDSMVSWLREKLHIRSPSGVFMALGAATGEGFALGIEGSEERVNSATRAMLSAGGAGGGGGATTGAAARATAAFHIEINVAPGTPSEQLEDIKAAVESVIVEHYERAQLEAA